MPELPQLFSVLNDAGGVIALIIVIWSHLTGRQTKDLETLQGAVKDLQNRASATEAALQSLPRAEAVGELRVHVARIEGQLSVIDERLKPVARMMERMQDWFVEQGK